MTLPIVPTFTIIITTWCQMMIGVQSIENTGYFGGQRWNRTTDTRIFSPFLFWISTI